MEGSCLCEGVKFTVDGEPENVFICYCTHCSKNAGGEAQISAKYLESSVHVQEGAPLLKTWILKDTISGSEKHKVFCGRCGCTLWTVPMKHGGSHLIVRTAMFKNGLAQLRPRAEFFASRKLAQASGLNSFETMPGY